MDISVIIPTYNGKKLLQQSLPFLERSLQTISSFEIIIVDNHSTDETEVLIAHEYPHIIYEPLSDNYGFTKAVNHGAHKAKGRFLLFLNNDCFLEENTIQQLMNFLHTNPHYIATQPIVKNKSNNIEQIGYTIDLARARAHPVRDPSYFHKNIDILNQPHQSLEHHVFKNKSVYGLSATCLLIHKDIFMDIGMFDESFHSYLEDVDLFLRLALQGYQFSPTLTATCMHKHMATSSTMGYYKEYRDLANWIRIILKNYTREYILSHFFSLSMERLKNLSGLVKKMVKLNA